MNDAELTIPALEVVVRGEWIGGGHLSIGQYSILYDQAADLFREELGIGKAYAMQGFGLFIVESHIAYRREVLLGDQISVTSQLVAFDEKRMHLYHKMQNVTTGVLASSGELMFINFDKRAGRSCAFAPAVLVRFKACLVASRRAGIPADVGRGIRGIKLTP